MLEAGEVSTRVEGGFLGGYPENESAVNISQGVEGHRITRYWIQGGGSCLGCENKAAIVERRCKKRVSIWVSTGERDRRGYNDGG